jgi:transposase
MSHHDRPVNVPPAETVVTLLQFLEGRTDRQAADAVRGRIDWKYALGLALTDPSFAFSVLSAFRTRLVEEAAEQRLLTILLARRQQEGLLKAQGRQRTDSTHVLAAVRTMNRLELVGETRRFALHRLAAVAPDWLRAQVTPAWFERYSVRVENYRLPKADSQRQALAATIGADGYHLLQVAIAPQAPPEVRAESAVEVLRQVWVQQYAGPEPPVRWRTEGEVPPPERLSHSPYDVEARYSLKRGMAWVGYKAHLTETGEDELPRLITHVATTAATTPDDAVTATIHDDLAARGWAPAAHLVDAGYTTAAHLVTSRDEHAIDLIGPLAASASWQARAGAAYDLRQFTIEWETQTVTCPRGKQSRAWEPRLSPAGTAQIHVRFRRQNCRACPCRSDCTRSKTESRALTFQPQAEFQALQLARQRQTTPEF